MLKQPPAAKSEPEPYRFTVEEWHRLGEAGFYTDDPRVELLDGEIIHMSPTGNRHALAFAFLNDRLADFKKGRFLIWPGNPVEADNRSEPLPDLTLVSRSHGTTGRHPLSRDVFLIVEISDTTLSYDRGRKLRKYAATGVREYWIVNLKDDTIEVHRKPAGDQFEKRTIHKAGESVSPLAFPDVTIAVADIIPAR